MSHEVSQFSSEQNNIALNRGHYESKYHRSPACYEREIDKLKQQRDDLLEACKETQKLFAFIAENYKSAPHFPNAEKLVDAAIAKCKA